MIPFQILACEIILTDGKKEEVRALELWDSGFTFRLCDFVEEAAISSVKVSFFLFAEYQYQTIELEDFTFAKEAETEFYSVYQLKTSDARFCELSKRVREDYTSYIYTKLEEEEAELAHKLTGYPADADEIFPEDMAQWKQIWLADAAECYRAREQEVAADIAVQETPVMAKTDMEVAVALHRPGLWMRYLAVSLEEFLKEYWAAYGLAEHPLTRLPVTRLLIGSNVCRQLFPSNEVLEQLKEKAAAEQLSVTIVFAPMQETEVVMAAERFAILAHWPETIHLTLELNDWGMLRLAQNYAFAKGSLTLGPLLCKRRKDVRMRYKKYASEISEEENTSLQRTSYQASFFQTFLRDTWQVERYSAETCGYVPEIEEGSMLYFPFFQMNTAAQCTLYAASVNNDRGRQTPDHRGCEALCEKQCFLYPKHLPMLGRYNTLYGLDVRFLKDPKYVEAYLEQKPGCLVWNL